LNSAVVRNIESIRSRRSADARRAGESTVSRSRTTRTPPERNAPQTLEGRRVERGVRHLGDAVPRADERT
jgi:hypothetical protein